MTRARRAPSPAPAAKWTARRPPPREDIIKRSITDVLELKRLVVHRMQSVAGKAQSGQWVRAGEPGIPDLLVELPGGRCIWLEVKRPGRWGRVEPHQAAWHAAARARGQRVAVVTSVEEALVAVQQAIDA